jgi:hypothetical protein
LTQLLLGVRAILAYGTGHTVGTCLAQLFKVLEILGGEPLHRPRRYVFDVRMSLG